MHPEVDDLPNLLNINDMIDDDLDDDLDDEDYVEDEDEMSD